MSDIEFFHAGLLDPEQTVEASALMKNDRIGVFPNRKAERARHTEDVRLQRESDRQYFEDLRGLLPNPNIDGSSMSGCDVILDCQGKVVDGRGYSQNVLATTVRANSVNNINIAAGGEGGSAAKVEDYDDDDDDDNAKSLSSKREMKLI
jgi:hypothetical protein